MSETKAFYFDGCSLTHRTECDVFFAAYASVTTIRTVTTASSVTRFNKYRGPAKSRKCEINKDGVLIARKPTVKIFGEVEMDLLQSIRH